MQLGQVYSATISNCCESNRIFAETLAVQYCIGGESLFGLRIISHQYDTNMAQKRIKRSEVFTCCL